MNESVLEGISSVTLEFTSPLFFCHPNNNKVKQLHHQFTFRFALFTQTVEVIENITSCPF